VSSLQISTPRRLRADRDPVVWRVAWRVASWAAWPVRTLTAIVSDMAAAGQLGPDPGVAESRASGARV
jgi:hypothetical protein